MEVNLHFTEHELIEMLDTATREDSGSNFVYEWDYLLSNGETIKLNITAGEHINNDKLNIMKDTLIKYDKLRVITRRDLKPAYQAVQSCHSAIQFQHEYPELAKNWFLNSNYLIFLSVNNEKELNSLIDRAMSKNIKISVFREPDINNEITAITLEPSDDSKRMTSGLKLMK